MEYEVDGKDGKDGKTENEERNEKKRQDKKIKDNDHPYPWARHDTIL